MKRSFRTIVAVTALLLVASCGPKDVQPIQSLSGIETTEMRVDNVTVDLGNQYLEHMNGRINKEQEQLSSQRERLAGVDPESYRGKQNSTAAKNAIEKAEKKIASLEEQIAAIKTDVKDAIQLAIANKFAGNRGIDLDVTIDSLSLTNGAAVILIGGSDTMTGTLKISDSQSKELLGEYHITNFDANGGILGAVVRGSDARGQMINEFSEKVSGILAGEYAE